MATATVFFAGFPHAMRHIEEKIPESFAQSLRGFEDFYDGFVTGDPSAFLSFLLLFLITLAGAYFPDLDLKLAFLFDDPKKRKRYLYHRQTTHSLLLCLAAAGIAVKTNNPYLFFFSLGWASHLFGDMLTGSVPILLWGKGYSPFSRVGIDRFLYFIDWRKRSAMFSGVAALFDFLAVPMVLLALYLLWILR